MEKEKEKESSRRSWPWKKKSPSEKLATNASVVSAGTSPNSSSLFEEQQPQQQQRWDLHHRSFSVQMSPQKDVSAARVLQTHYVRAVAADEAIQQQQSGDKAKSVSEQLATALADITIKDNLVKQHIKVAEEAVSGWEKAEAEAVALKLQLDAALQQKLATEDRVAHLDGALKECMKQLRHVREEQEQLIHDTLVKKTREYDKLRVEMETKLAEASQILSQTRTELLESRAEGKALSHALQERSRSLAELGESKGRVEADIKILQVRLEAMEKENANLKYEVHVLNKELEIRNEEREYERKAADIAAKQHLESVKKIAKLEEECNRLRVLIRKKLPGPAALQRMRHEVEGLGKVDAIESKRRRSLGHSGRHMDPSLMGMMQENVHDDLGYNGMSSGIAEKMAAMDEEMKMLKEALAQRNEELQNAHVTCVKTANRLSLVEEELDRALGVQHQSKQQEIKTLIKGGSHHHHHHHHHHSTDMDTNGDASSDAWASALVAELDQFKKKSKVLLLSNGHTDKGQASLSYELMDDFVEMERLAKMSEPAKSEITYSDSASFDGPRESPLTAAASDQIQELEGELASTRRELESANHTICGLNAKLAMAEEQLTALQSRNSANEVLLINLQDQLDRLNEIQSDMERGGDGPPALSDQMSGFSIKDILARGRENGQTGSVSETCSSEVEAPEEHDASVSDAESKASTAHLELAASLLKIVGILEALAQATGSEHTLFVTMHSDGTGKMLGSHLQGERGAQIAQSMQWKDLELENAMQILVLTGNKLLQGKCDMVEFISELASALDRIILLKPFEIRSSHQATECDEDDDDDDSELLAQQQRAQAQATATMMNLNELKCAPLFLPNGEINTADQRSPVKEELPPRPSNQFVGAVASTIATTEVEDHLRGRNADIEDHLNVVNEKMEQLKVQEEEESLLLFDHEMHQDDTQEDSEGLKEDELLEEELMVLSSVNPRVVSSLQAATGEMNHLHDKVAALEVQLHDERQQHQEVMAKLENLQHQLQLNASKSEHSGGSHARNGDWTSHSTSQDEDTKSRKEQEDREMAAAALAECQRTIQALGKQLQVMGTVPPLVTTTQERTETSVDSSTDSVTSIKKPSTNREILQWQTNAAEVIPCLPDIADAHNHSPSALRERSSSSPWVVTTTVETPPHPGGGKLSPIPTPPGRQYKGRPASADQSFYGWHQGGENGHRFGNDYTDSAGTVPPSPPALSELSGHGSMSMPASPVRSPGSVLRSLRKRSSNGPKSLSEDSVAADETPPQKPRTSSTFSRFYSRSRSGSSGSSG